MIPLTRAAYTALALLVATTQVGATTIPLMRAGKGAVSVPAPTGDILMVDGASLILQTDGASFVCLAGGC